MQRKGPADAADAGVDLDFLPSTLGYNIRRVNALCMQAMQAAMRDYDVAMGEFAALFVIGANPGITQTHLSTALSMDPSRTVLVVDTLEKRRLAERRPSPNDRRSRALYLTPEGVTMVDRLRDRARASEADLFASRLSASEWTALIDMLIRLQGEKKG